MGVIYSIPLCSRGDAAKDNNAATEDANNNQPMPSMHGAADSVTSQPTSIANDNARPDATSTPKSNERLQVLDAGKKIKYLNSCVLISILA